MPAAARQLRATEATEDDEITIERRVRVPPDAAYGAGRATTRMTRVDERLLAITRGELEPDDPFGGLIPIYDDPPETLDEQESEGVALTPACDESSLFGKIVPRVCMTADRLLSLPLDAPCRLFLSQVDGRRTLEEILDACGLDEISGLEATDDLLRHCAIFLV